MKKKENTPKPGFRSARKGVVIITALLTFGAIGVTAKMHHHKHAQYAQSESAQEHCMMWNACGSDEAAITVEE
jgi:hypothetical protein